MAGMGKAKRIKLKREGLYKSVLHNTLVRNINEKHQEINVKVRNGFVFLNFCCISTFILS